MGLRHSFVDSSPMPSLGSGLQSSPSIFRPQPSNCRGRERAYQLLRFPSGLGFRDSPWTEQVGCTDHQPLVAQPFPRGSGTHSPLRVPNHPNSLPTLQPNIQGFSGPHCEHFTGTHLSLQCCPGDPHTPLSAVAPLCLPLNHTARYKTQMEGEKKCLHHSYLSQAPCQTNPQSQLKTKVSR